jgi:2-keto-3-deoxy-L-rhamnonate aldolase RhmA
MAVTQNTAKQKLINGELAIGLGLRQSRTVDMAKVAKACGFDWLFIDMEHTSIDVFQAGEICVAALDTGVTPLVRVPGHQHYHATRVLDAGAMGIVVPDVSTPEQARQIARNCLYPPQGYRSIGGAPPQSGYAQMPVGEMMEQLNRNTLLVAMLESPEAIERAEAIAAVDGIDVLLIGTNDFTTRCGIPGQLGHERVEEAYREVIAATHKHGKFAGMGGVYDEALMQKYINLGARFLLGGGDMALLMAAARARVSAIRAMLPAAAG